MLNFLKGVDITGAADLINAVDRCDLFYFKTKFAKYDGEDGAGGGGSGDSGDSDGQGTDGHAAGDTETNEVEGLKAAAQAERVKRQETEAELESFKTQQRIINANPQPAGETEAKSLYVRTAESLNIDPEYPSPEDNGRILESMMSMSNAANQQTQFFSSHSDYADVVGESLPNGGFKIAAPLQRIIDSSDNPLQLQQQIATMTPQVAYALARTDPTFKKEQADKGKSAETKAAEAAEEIITNAAKKVSVSAAEGGGGTEQTAAILKMSDADFDKHIEDMVSEA